jgi:hypothetical protein
LRIPLKEGVGGETRGDGGEREDDFMDKFIKFLSIFIYRERE